MRSVGGPPGRPPVTSPCGAVGRRTVLLGGCAAIAGALGIAGCAAPTSSARSAASPAPVAVETGSFVSERRRGARVGWTVVRPTAVTGPLPVALVLHGMGERNDSMVTALRYDRFLAAAVGAGTPPFALAAADGEDRFWHPRADGDDPRGMLVHEFLPLLSGRGLSTDRIAVTGWSMGGYGALLLAATLGRRRVAAAAVGSPALFDSSEQALELVPHAFDGAADYRRHDVHRMTTALDGIPLRIDCGADDPLAGACRRFADDLTPRPAGGIEPGDHTPGFWRGVAPAQLTLLGRSLGAS